MNLVYFLLMIIPLVLFHELGHFIAARWFDVKCERFAVGMGPIVAAFTRGDTEYSFRALPLGGYVQMLGMDPDEDVDPADKGRALTDKPVWQRMVIYLAGPVANFLLAIPIFFLVFAGDAERAGAVIGVVTDGSAAAEAGLLAGDEVIAIDGDEIRYWDDLSAACAKAPGTPLTFTIRRDGAEQSLVVTPEAVRTVEPLLGLRTTTVGQIGVMWRQRSSHVQVTPGSPAALSGVETFDQILRVGETETPTWLALQDALASAPDPVQLTLLRSTPTATSFASLDVRDVVMVELRGHAAAGQVGVEEADATVFGVVEGSPAARAGLQRGDRLVRWNDRAIRSVDVVLQRMRGVPDEPATLVIERDGVEQTLEIQPEVMAVVGELRSERDVTFIGFVGLPLSLSTVEPAPVLMGRGETLLHAAITSVTETWKFLGAIFFGVLGLIIGSVDSSNLGGPLMIADVANRAAEAGMAAFLILMAKISINLGIINLVPVPGLDGGNLVLLAAEGVKREPLSYRTRQIINYVGLVCIVLLMLFVFKNDIERYWVDVANWLNS
jgi:regulator of sigma E protease